jgi:hypothetical protein
MAHRSDRREGTPITALATKAVQAIGPSRADSMMARSHTAPRTRPKIRLQSDGRAATRESQTATTLRARQGPAAVFDGALRAALTRARAAAGGSYATKENLRRVKEKTFSTDLLFS